MAIATYSSYKMNECSIGNPRDASFSSYLDANERDFVRNLAESIHSLSPTRDPSSPRVSIGRKDRIPRVELGVFGAERYFNEKLDDTNNKKKKSPIPKEGVNTPSNRQRHNRREKRDHHFERKSSKSTTSTTTTTNSSLKSPTPSLKSELSWNSQFGLFLPKKTSSGLRIFSGFQCKGSCFDKKSVYTATAHQRVHQSPRIPIPRVSNHEHFAFPIIDTASPHHYKKTTQIPLDHHDPPRESIDVFGLHHVGKQEIEQNLERKLSILAWDAIPKHSSPNAPLPFPFPSTNKGFDDDDIDVRSDCSSDLFEIENLVGVGKESSAISQLSDTSTCMTPMTHCDAPSEASIEWSVITASAADFSLINDVHVDDKIAIRKKIFVESGNKVQKNNSSSSGLLLGCRNHKAVDVVTNNNKYNVKNGTYRRNNEIMGNFDVKGSPNIAPSTPSRRSSLVAGTTLKSYALAYA